jgi:hypothetical protein
LRQCLARQEKAALAVASLDVGAGVPADVGVRIVSGCEARERPDVEAFSRCMVDEAATWRATHQ